MKSYHEESTRSQYIHPSDMFYCHPHIMYCHLLSLVVDILHFYHGTWQLGHTLRLENIGSHCPETCIESYSKDPENEKMSTVFCQLLTNHCFLCAYAYLRWRTFCSIHQSTRSSSMRIILRNTTRVMTLRLMTTVTLLPSLYNTITTHTMC